MSPRERSNEYRFHYYEYGMESKPVRERNVESKKNEGIIFSARDKVLLVFFLIFIGALAVGSIQVSAYAADVQCKMNEVIKENTVISGEIENLNVKLNKANNIETIEQKAVATLGMMYPNPNDFVYIEDNKPAAVDFALLLNE